MLVPKQDVEFLLNQDEGKLNMIVAGMTAIINDNIEHAESMKNQNWFQRMIKTVTGQNKVTVATIRDNHDTLNLYAVQAIGELYKHQRISQEIIINVGNKMNELYFSHLEFKKKTGELAYALNMKIEDVERRTNERLELFARRIGHLEQYNVELKYALGGFAEKLRDRIESTEKRIDSVENFNLLSKEIEQGVYGSSPSFISLFRVLAQIDYSTINDIRRLGIIQREMIKVGILSSESLPISDYLMQLMLAPDEFIGVIYTELLNYSGGDNRLALLSTEAIERWNYESDLNRSLMSINKVVKHVLDRHCIDDLATITGENLCSMLIETKKKQFIIGIPAGSVKIPERSISTDTQISLHDIAKKYKVFMDSDVVLTPNANVFFDSLIKLVDAKSARVLFSREAERAISQESNLTQDLFNKLKSKDFIESRPEETNEEVHNAIIKYFSNANASIKLLFLTQNESLARRVKKENIGTQHRVLAGFIREDGMINYYE